MTNTTLDGSAAPAVVPADTTVQLNAGDDLFLLGAIDNLGTIFADATGILSEGPTPPALASTVVASIVLASPTVMLSGGGTLLMTEVEYDQIYSASADISTLINVDNTIEGSGEIGNSGAVAFSDGGTAYPIGFIDQVAGVVDADAMDPLVVATTGDQTLTNAGLVEATGSGELVLEGTIVDNTGGTILDGTDAIVEIESSTLEGGTLIVDAGAYLGLDGAPVPAGGTYIAPTLRGVTIETATSATVEFAGTLDGTQAPVYISAGTTLATYGSETVTLMGAIDDLGLISLQYQYYDNAGTVVLTGSIDNLGTILVTNVPLEGFAATAPITIGLNTSQVTLGGRGALVLSSTSLGATSILPSGLISASLINIDNVISGGGTIGAYPFSGEPVTVVGLTNDAMGVVDANDAGFALSVFSGALGIRNAGLMEATASGGLSINASTLDNTGGTVLASGAGDVVTLEGIDVVGGLLKATGGGTLQFTGTDTLDLSLAGGAAGTGLSLGGDSTLAVSGTLVFGGTLSLDDGGLVLLNGGQLAGLAGASVINVSDTITGGTIGDGTNALSLTNEAAGVISDVDIDLPGGLRNAGLVEATAGDTLNIGVAAASTIDNLGGTLLADGGSVVVDDADIIGGTLKSDAGGMFLFGSRGITNDITLDGSGAPLTIDPGTTIQTYYTEQSPPFVFTVGPPITLIGTIENFGTLLGTGLYYGASPINAGLLYGPGTITGGITNNGTLLAEGGRMYVDSVGGTGSIAIAAGATFDLGVGSGQAIDFRGSVGSLVFSQPVYYNSAGTQPTQYYTGALTNLVSGDSINLLGENIASANVVNGATLALAMTDTSAIDYALVNFQAGDSVKVVSATAAVAEYYDFTYSGAGTTDSGYGPDFAYGAQESGTGWFAVTTSAGTVGLSSVTAFQMMLSGNTNEGTITYTQSSLQGFSASFGVDDTLTSLSLTTGNGLDSEGPVINEVFAISNLGTAGAMTENSVEPDGPITQGSIDITSHAQQFSELVVACFAEGSRILTMQGAVPAEALRVGAVVATASGGRRRVVWTGHRRIDCRRHSRPDEVMPIRIRAHAFGPNLPHTDLRLSPDHAVFADGVLIPVRYLVNGATILREDVASVTYWHVEMDAHDVLLAEGLPVESYLDTGNRGAFMESDGAVAMHADFARGVWDRAGCAPLVLDGAELEAVRSVLLEQAEALGHVITREAGLHLVVDGSALWPEIAGRVHRFRLPATAGRVRLVSRHAVPTEVRADSSDYRRLGVAVSRCVLDEREVALSDARLSSGWHRVESHWRWTDGDAGLALAGARVLEIEVAMTERYWVERPEKRAHAA
jgi:hypothetical protein